MSDDPNSRAPEPKSDESAPQLAAPKPAEAPGTPARAELDSKAKAALRSSLPKAKPASAPKAAARVQRQAKPPAQAPAKKAAAKRAAPKAEPPAAKALKPAEPAKPAKVVQRKAEPAPQAKPRAEKPAKKAEPTLTKAPTPPAPPKPAKMVQREAEPAPKPRAEEPPSKTAAAKVEPSAVQPNQAPSPKPARPLPAPKPAAVVPATAPSAAVPGASATAAPPAAVPAVQRTAAAAEPLDAIGRRLLSRLQRAEQALSPWTRQSLQLHQSAPLTPATDQPGPTPGDVDHPLTQKAAGPGTTAEARGVSRTASPAGSLAMRVQRQERQGPAGTFGRLAGGLERTDRFASRILAHFPPVAAKYEPPPAPEAGAANPPPEAKGPIFTYYPESPASVASRQPTMTAAEVLERFGGTPTTPPVQRTPAPAPASEAPKPSAPVIQSPRDPRRVRRFSKVEELSPRNAPPVEPPALPEAQPAPRKPQAERAAPPPPAPRAPTAAKAETPTSPKPPRRRSHSEEVGPAQAAPTVQRAPSEPAKPAAPTPAAADPGGPLNWSHLTNLPPSMQRQLERVQQQLAEQSGLVGPPVSVGNTERPFFPRNPKPPPMHPDQPARSRAATADEEPEQPISFGPDLQAHPAGVQRQAQTPTGLQVPGEPTAGRPAIPPRAPAEPARDRAEEIGSDAESVEPERTRPGTAGPFDELTENPPAIQRMPEASPAPSPALRQQEMPLVTPPEPALPESERLDSQPVEAPSAGSGLAGPSAESDVAEDAAAVQRSTEPGLLAGTALTELPLEPPPAEKASAVRRQRVEPADRLPLAEPLVEPHTSPIAPKSEPPAVQRQQAKPADRLPLVEPRTSSKAPKSEPPSAQHQRAEPTDLSARVEPGASPAAPKPVPPAVQRQLAEPVGRPPLAESPTSFEPTVPEPPAELPPTPPAETAISTRPTPQPLILRQPALPEDSIESEAESEAVAPEVEPGEAPAPVPSAPEHLPGAMDTNLPLVQRSALPEPPLVLREPPATQVKPVAPVQRAPAATPPQTEPPSHPAPHQADSRLPEPPAAPQPPTKQVERAELAPPSRATPAADIERKAIESVQPPLTLRQPPAEVTPETLSEPAPDAGDEIIAAVPVAPDVQRLTLPADEMPLRTPPPPMLAPETAADSRPRVSAPEPLRPAGIQRQAELQPQRRPAPDMPLRQPEAAPEPEPRNPPSNRGPELSLGRQIYARGVKDAQMPVFGALATNVRRTLQRNPSETPAPGAALALGAPAVSGQARTASGLTPVLPQARIQRLDQPEEDRPSAPPQPNGPALLEVGPLPLAPPGPAPENPVDSNVPPTRRWQSAMPRVNNPNLSQSVQQPLVGEGVVGQGQGQTPTTGGWVRATPRALGGGLPLAPVVTRDRSNAQSQPSTTNDGSGSSELGDLTSDEDDDALETTDSDTAMGEINLDDLADQLLPYIKRLMAIERDRRDPI